MTDPRVQTEPTGPLPPNAMAPRKRPWLLWLMIAVMVVVPILEVALIGTAAGRIGVGWTIVLLCLSGVVGAWLSKREGSRAWQALKGAFTAGRMPTGELADAALVLTGGILLMLPGFLSDVVGLLLLLPLTRPLFRTILGAAIARQTTKVGLGGVVPGLGRTTGSTQAQRPTSTDDVVPGEVIEVDPSQIER